MPKHALSYAMIYEIVSKLCGKLIKCLRLCCDLWLSKNKTKKTQRSIFISDVDLVINK